MGSVLIVGGAGYIGSHVALEFLNAGFKVTVFDNLSSGQQINQFKNADFIHGDLQDRSILRKVFKNNYDVVIHMAALKAAGESMAEPEKYSRQNITGTINLLEAVSSSTTRALIFSSTAAVYGPPEYLPINEEHPTEPINYYGFTKLEIERFLQWYDKLKGIKFAALRYFNAAGYDSKGRVQGLEKNPANLIPVVMEVAAGLRESMEVFGDDFPTKDGSGVRDYIHVSDLASAHLKAYNFLEREKKSFSVNVGTGKGLSVFEIIKAVEEVSGNKISYTVVPRRDGDPAELYATPEKANVMLDWSATFSDLDSIIKTTWDVYKAQV